MEAAFMNKFFINEFISYISPDFLGTDGVSGTVPDSFRHFDEMHIEKLGNNLRIEERNKNV